MSSSEDKAPEREAFQRLDGAVSTLLERAERLGSELSQARRRIGELEELLQRFQEDAEAPARMQERLKRLEEENGLMRSRLEEGRAGVERLLAKIRFLEEQR